MTPGEIALAAAKLSGPVLKIVGALIEAIANADDPERAAERALKAVSAKKGYREVARGILKRLKPRR